MEQYMVSVDAGGTKTRACAYDKAGNLLQSKVTDFGNLSLDYDLAFEHIIKAVEGCIAAVSAIAPNDKKCAFVCVGAAGIETGSIKQQLKRDMESSLRIPVYASNDAVLALYAALEGKDGVLVVSGTGSIASCKWKGEISRVGGWGHLINDDGGGYSIGARAIRCITDNNDNDMPSTPLEVGIFSHLGIKELKELISFVYSHQKSDIAALVPVVERLAESGDKQSVDILVWAGEQLAALVFQICRRHNVSAPLIGISGSVITKTRMTRMAFESAISARFTEYHIVACQNDPAKGGYYIWLEQMQHKSN